MIRLIFFALLTTTVMAAGCSDESTTSRLPTDPAMASAGTSGTAIDSDPSAIGSRVDDAGPASSSVASVASVAGKTTEITLRPQNTKIGFVGLHAGDKPDPREGTFEAFSGKAVIVSGSLASLEVIIDTTSVSTQIDRLTNHLKSPDFFDVNEHPESTFKSTSIQTDGTTADQVTVNGDLTLHGVTKSISFPATVATDDGLRLNAEFSIDRTEFGMDYSADKVVADVSMTVSIDG
jgi:polyisoprenoid-binding protein YceI